MLWILSFARSGSTVLQEFLGKLFDYHDIFEPFMEEPEKIKGLSDFKTVHDWFRGAPRLGDLSRFKISDFYVGRIPESEFFSPAVQPYREKLAHYIQTLYTHYGPGMLIKEVRQQGNVPFICSIMKELNIPADFILLKRNPFEIAYSYYRLAGFHRRSTWSVNELFEYRKAMYRGEDKEIDRMFDTVSKPFDKLVAAVIADYRAFDIACSRLQAWGVNVLILNYEDFITDTFKTCKVISSRLNLPVGDEKIGQTIAQFKLKPDKLMSSLRDPIYSRLAGNVRKRMADWLPEVEQPAPGILVNKLKFWHIKVFLRNILPFIKTT